MRDLIARDLPDTPNEIIDKWLVTFTDREPWPPTQMNGWRYILGKGRDLEYLQRLSWKKSKLKLGPTLFLPRSVQTAYDLVRTHILKEATIYSNTMADGNQRFDSCKEYLKAHGEFPWPIVLEKMPTGYDVLDGHHRLSAFLYLYGYFEIERDEVPCLNVKAEQFVWEASHV